MLALFFAIAFGLSWWLLLVVGIPAVSYAGAAIKGTLGAPFPFSPWIAVLPALLTTLLVAAVIVWINRKQLFDRAAGVIDLLAPATSVHAASVQPT